MKQFTAKNPQEATVIRNLWLHYFNDVLLDKAVISTDEHDKMAAKINTVYRIPDRSDFSRINR